MEQLTHKRNKHGRFVKLDHHKVGRLTVRLDQSMIQQLEVAAELGDCTKTDIIKDAIAEWLSAQRHTLQPDVIDHGQSDVVPSSDEVTLPIDPAGHGKDETRLQDSIIPDRDRRPPVGDWLNLEGVAKQLNDNYSTYASVMRGAYPGCNTNEGKTDRLRILGVYIDWSRYKSIRSRAFKLLGKPIDDTTAIANGSS